MSASTSANSALMRASTSEQSCGRTEETEEGDPGLVADVVGAGPDDVAEVTPQGVAADLIGDGKLSGMMRRRLMSNQPKMKSSFNASATMALKETVLRWFLTLTVTSTVPRHSMAAPLAAKSSSLDVSSIFSP